MAKSKRKRKNRKQKIAYKNKPSKNKPEVPVISICMIVKNEKAHLPACLESLKGLDAELIIVDTGSTDGTVQIAKDYGAKVFYFPWNNNFSDARNESLKHAASRWILWLDADDIVPGSEHEKIRKLAQQEPNKGFSFILRNQGIDDSRCYQLRMFPNRPNIRFEGAVHEQVARTLDRLKIPIEMSDVMVIHTGYSSVQVVMDKKNKYIRMMSSWLQEHPEDCLIRYQYAMTLHTIDRHRDATEAFEVFFKNSKCLNQDRNILFYSLILTGRSYLNLGNFPKALHHLLEAEKLDSESDFLKVSLAEIYTNLNNMEKALQELESIGDLTHPKISFIPLDYGILHFAQNTLFASNLIKLNRLEQAQEYLKKAEQLKPERAEIAYYWGEWYERSGDLNKALSFYKEAIEKSPDTFLYHFKKGNLHLAMGDASHSKKEYEICQQLIPNTREILTNLGILERLYGRFDASLAYLEKAIQNDSGEDELYFQKALTLYDQKEYEKSVRSLQELDEEGRPEKAALLLLLNWLCLGEIQNFGDALKLFSGHYNQIEKFTGRPLEDAFLILSEDYGKNGRYYESEFSYTMHRLLKKDPSTETLETLAEIQMQAFHLNAAIGSLENLILKSQNLNGLIRYFRYLGQCYTSLGTGEAVDMCRHKIEELASQ
ncbi:SPBc2 prophage-derived glycosyltransferase SunS [bacterium BMS3Bbin03]|nr:SPBc2 prophage-derived glycosyltransferase SunS [bacterium BMS3Bbin03]